MIRHGILCLVLAMSFVAGCGEAAAPVPSATQAPGVCKHNVMDADCFYCHPELVQKLGFCKEHDVSEAECWICKPSIAAAYKAQGDWCGEHGLPESKCKQCAK
jgi:hypothetical protein